MRNWTVRVVVVEAYKGNPADPLIWHFVANCRTQAEAIAQTRRNPQIPAGARISAFPAI